MKRIINQSFLKYFKKFKITSFLLIFATVQAGTVTVLFIFSLTSLTSCKQGDSDL
ncbi:hypothetical protein MuYL_4545 [Mucilaginibacter xinganensis]|uniref:Uncharacterized protein n=1 Tax=Mucilaginibacter xinganensis TaxID=1234841 RepID=A0A223P308_9SPHI|nr:hypothetical protein MuYL_4545 [Mucilaginibacter xinganensis]